MINTNSNPTYEPLTDQVQQFWHQYHNYITFSLPFLSFRLLTPFSAQETFAKRFLEGTLLAINAAAVEYGITHNWLQDYTLSYAPVIGTFLYKHNMFADNALLNLGVAVSGTSIVGYAWQTANLKVMIAPTITYITCAWSNFAKSSALVTTIVATAIDAVLANEVQCASWFIGGGAIAGNIAYQYESLKHYEVEFQAATMAGGVIGLSLANYQPIILEQLFTPEHFKNSYQSITQFVDKNSFDVMLQKNLISGINMQLAFGYFGNYLNIGVQDISNKLVAIGNAEQAQKHSAFNTFVSNTIQYIFKYLLPYMAIRLSSEILIIYNNKEIINMVEQELINKTLLTKENFIKAAKTELTVQSYLKDIAIIAGDLEIIQSSIFDIPKIVQLSDKFNMVTVLGLSAAVIVDEFVQKAFNYLLELESFYDDEKIKCNSLFESLTAYDRENAIAISQKDGLSYVQQAWDTLQQCQHNNNLLESMVLRTIFVSQFFYIEYTLYPLLNILVGYFSMQGSIANNELFLYARSLDSTANTILFKSKNAATSQKIESAVERLNNLVKHLNSDNPLENVTYALDLKSNMLTITDLDFTRGNKEQKIHIHIDELQLALGNIYAVTGANGSGKSSFTTLLKYIFEGIADASFEIKSGNIIFPTNEIKMIPQKDYIPYNSRLIDIILYPNQVDKLSAEMETQVVNHVNDLQVFAHDIISTDLYEVKNNWNDLSGGQKKKLFIIDSLISCPKILIMDEIFGPLDPNARKLLMNKILNSCLDESLIMIVWHQDQNSDGTNCVVDPFFDYELHVQNETFNIGQVGIDCWQ